MLSTMLSTMFVHHVSHHLSLAPALAVDDPKAARKLAPEPVTERVSAAPRAVRWCNFVVSPQYEIVRAQRREVPRRPGLSGSPFLAVRRITSRVQSAPAASPHKITTKLLLIYTAWTVRSPSPRSGSEVFLCT